MYQDFWKSSGIDETKDYEQLEERIEEKNDKVDSSSHNTKHSNRSSFQSDDKVFYIIMQQIFNSLIMISSHPLALSTVIVAAYISPLLLSEDPKE